MFKEHTKLTKVIVVVGSLFMTGAVWYGGYHEGARAGATYVIEQNYLMDTRMRDFFEKSKNCDLLDVYTDRLEKDYCSPKDDTDRTRLHYSIQTPWGFVTTSRMVNGKFN